jgi:hypothetical protein
VVEERDAQNTPSSLQLRRGFDIGLRRLEAPGRMIVSHDDGTRPIRKSIGEYLTRVDWFVARRQ